jgi:hypothetical protein
LANLLPVYRTCPLSGDEHDLYELSQLIRKYLKDEPYKKELLFGISRLILATGSNFSLRQGILQY